LGGRSLERCLACEADFETLLSARNHLRLSGVCPVSTLLFAPLREISVGLASEAALHGDLLFAIREALPLTFPPKDSGALIGKWSDSLAMTERVEMCRRTVVVDGKVYSVRRQSDSVFLLRLNDLAVRYVVVTADSIDFHGFERFVWPVAAGQISSFEKLDDAAAYYQKLTGSTKD
jgi:hypothetical protein